MTVSTKLEVYGVKDALKELQKTDKGLRKKINESAKTIAQPVTSAAKSNYPIKYLSGMARPWSFKGRQLFPYDQKKAVKGVVLKIDTSKRNQGLIVIIQKDPAAAIIDMAGKKGGTGARGGMFINNMNAFGSPSRVMWPAYERNAHRVDKEFRDLVERVMDAVGRNLVTS